uniref:FAD-dependent oxidoreductase n=1 Tax=Paenibacillus camerounensis TaxID=1243663 RepID=UPI0012FC7F2A
MNNGYITLPSAVIPVTREVDVLVIGGGASGIAAAIAAAQGGASTMLVEQRGFLGGMGTVALVPAFCPFTDKQKPIVRGLGLQLMEQMKEACGPAFRKEYQDMLDWVPIDPEVLKRVYDDAVLESGVTPLYHTFVYDVVLSPDRKTVEGVIVVNKTGRSFISCR